MQHHTTSCFAPTQATPFPADAVHCANSHPALAMPVQQLRSLTTPPQPMPSAPSRRLSAPLRPQVLLLLALLCLTLLTALGGPPLAAAAQQGKATGAGAKAAASGRQQGKAQGGGGGAGGRGSVKGGGSGGKGSGSEGTTQGKGAGEVTTGGSRGSCGGASQGQASGSSGSCGGASQETTGGSSGSCGGASQGKGGGGGDGGGASAGAAGQEWCQCMASGGKAGGHPAYSEMGCGGGARGFARTKDDLLTALFSNSLPEVLAVIERVQGERYTSIFTLLLMGNVKKWNREFLDYGESWEEREGESENERAERWQWWRWWLETVPADKRKTSQLALRDRWVSVRMYSLIADDLWRVGLRAWGEWGASGKDDRFPKSVDLDSLDVDGLRVWATEDGYHWVYIAREQDVEEESIEWEEDGSCPWMCGAPEEEVEEEEEEERLSARDVRRAQGQGGRKKERDRGQKAKHGEEALQGRQRQQQEQRKQGQEQKQSKQQQQERRKEKEEQQEQKVQKQQPQQQKQKQPEQKQKQQQDQQQQERKQQDQQQSEQKRQQQRQDQKQDQKQKQQHQKQEQEQQQREQQMQEQEQKGRQQEGLEGKAAATPDPTDFVVTFTTLATGYGLGDRASHEAMLVSGLDTFRRDYRGPEGWAGYYTDHTGYPFWDPRGHQSIFSLAGASQRIFSPKDSLKGIVGAAFTIVKMATSPGVCLRLLQACVITFLFTVRWGDEGLGCRVMGV